jgi:cyclopropane fatty-acyl-phospholipid synthase-like methyltransferase
MARIPQDRTVDVLDAGTGFGQYAYWLLRRYPHARVTAVDVKADYLDRLGGFLGEVGLADRVTLREQDLTLPPSEVEAYDLVVSVDVMEHIEDDRAVLRHFRQMLRPGGFVVINTPSDRGGSDVEAEGESFIGEHVRDGYAPEDLAAKLEEAGLEVVEWTYTYGRYGSAAWRLLIKHPIRALNRSWALAPLLVPYYAVAGPLGMALHALDLRARKPEGTGLLVVARRPT